MKVNRGPSLALLSFIINKSETAEFRSDLKVASFAFFLFGCAYFAMHTFTYLFFVSTITLMYSFSGKNRPAWSNGLKGLSNAVRYYELYGGRTSTMQLEGDKPWGGNTNILARKKQIPSKDYGPKDVIRICLQALQSNDDPQLDHGACVVMSFKSPSGMLSEGRLDPAQYGRFLRSTEPYNLLVDFKQAETIGPLESMSEDETRVRQGVLLKSFENFSGEAEQAAFDFYLTKTNEMWLLDVILARERP